MYNLQKNKIDRLRFRPGVGESSQCRIDAQRIARHKVSIAVVSRLAVQFCQHLRTIDHFIMPANSYFLTLVFIIRPTVSTSLWDKNSLGYCSKGLFASKHYEIGLL